MTNLTTKIPNPKSDTPPDDWHQRFVAALDADLNLPRAIGIVWDMLRRDRATPDARKLALLLEFDQVLGLGLEEWLRQTKDEGRRTKEAEAAC